MGGATCVQSHIVTEDHAAAKRTARPGVMILDAYSLICQHPGDKSVGIIMTYSQRYYSGQRDPELGAKAAVLFDSIGFADF